MNTGAHVNRVSIIFIFCRYIYRRGSEPYKEILLQTTSRKLQRTLGFMYKAFSLARDAREQWRACKQIFCRYIYTVAGASALRSQALNISPAGAKE